MWFFYESSSFAFPSSLLKVVFKIKSPSLKYCLLQIKTLKCLYSNHSKSRHFITIVSSVLPEYDFFQTLDTFSLNGGDVSRAFGFHRKTKKHCIAIRWSKETLISILGSFGSCWVSCRIILIFMHNLYAT